MKFTTFLITCIVAMPMIPGPSEAIGTLAHAEALLIPAAQPSIRARRFPLLPPMEPLDIGAPAFVNAGKRLGSGEVLIAPKRVRSSPFSQPESVLNRNRHVKDPMALARDEVRSGQGSTKDLPLAPPRRVEPPRFEPPVLVGRVIRTSNGLDSREVELLASHGFSREQINQIDRAEFQDIVSGIYEIQKSKDKVKAWFIKNQNHMEVDESPAMLTESQIQDAHEVLDKHDPFEVLESGRAGLTEAKKAIIDAQGPAFARLA